MPKLFARTDKVKYAPRAGRFPHMRATKNGELAYQAAAKGSGDLTRSNASEKDRG